MKKRYIVSAICLIGFIIVTLFVITNNMVSFDEFFYNALIRNSFFDIFFKCITYMGNVIPIGIAVVILILIFKDKKYRLIIISNVLLSVGFNQLLKHIICRERPDYIRLITERGYSYPSGHSMIAICLYGTILYLIIKSCNNKKLKILCSIIIMAFILLLGISRVYVGVHYPSDVLGGYLLSTAIIIINISLINKHFRGNKNEKTIGS